YFPTLSLHDALPILAYNWRWRQPLFTMIIAIMLIPAQASAVGFFQFMYKIGWTNSFLPLILPAIASPAVVFFMRQFLLGAMSLELVESARIDGSGEFMTFNRIVLPIMLPAIAVQSIFIFVGSWNNLFMPLILLTQKEKFTLPIMVSLLRGDIYRTEFGSIYLG